VLFLSDNGGPTAELSSSNEPLRGGKGQLFEGGIRIPFAAQWPGRLPAGKVENNPVSSLDILPTALRAAGRTVPSDLDGIDLGSSRADRTLFWRYGPNLALRKGKWKIVKQRTDSFALFDLDADPGETRDLAAALPARLADLRNELDRLNNQMRAPLW
ncbi:MAG: N-acetylgalactosamine-4-sulfatase, partial [Acidobacteria bacterium]|nr:N-acetylgalactosamine-4-sulfatase [Acidobacteriota bacterium]